MKVNIKNVLGIGAGAVVLAATSILALLNSKDEFTDFLENASDDELEAAREKVRLDFAILIWMMNIVLTAKIDCTPLTMK